MAERVAVGRGGLPEVHGCTLVSLLGDLMD